MKQENFFMIRKNNLYSNRGRYVQWGERQKAKVWTSLKSAQQAIKYHNTDEITTFKNEMQDYERYKDLMYKPKKKPPFYKDAEIVEFKLVEVRTV